MLQFIYGKASSGKTYTLINKIKELCQNGEEACKDNHGWILAIGTRGTDC